MLARGVIFPRRFIDEFLYWNLANNLSHGRGLSWNGEPLLIRSWLYPVVIAPLFRIAGTINSQYHAIQLLNSLMLCSVVFPTWWMARRYVGAGMALFAAVFAVSVPAMNYAGIIGTESLAYLTCTVAFAAMLLALARPGWRTAIAAIVLVGVAVMTRTQFALLAPVFVASLLLVATMRGREGWRVYLAEQRILFMLLGVGAMCGVAFLLAEGRSSVGIYIQIFDGAPITAGNATFWLRGFASDVYLLTGIVPTIATFALLGASKNRRDEWVGPLLALALSASIFFTLQMTWFSASSTFPWREQHIFYERYMFYLGPLFFVGLVASIGRITARAAAISTAVGTLIVAATPHEIVAVPFSIDAFGQAFLGYLFSDNDSLLGQVGPLLGVLTALLGGALVLSALPEPKSELRKWGRWLALGLPLFLLLLTQMKAWSYSRLYSESGLSLQPKPVDFAARASGQRVGLLVAEGSDPSTFYATTFWNPNVDRLYVSAKSPVSSPRVYAPQCQFHWSQNGTIITSGNRLPHCRELPAAWLVQSNVFSMHLRDEGVRTKARGGVSSTVMASRRPARILTLTSGRQVRSGAVSEQLTMRSFLDRPGELEIVVRARARESSLRLPGGRVVELVEGRERTLRIPVGARDQLMRITVVSPSGATRSVVDFKRLRLREGTGPWRDVT